MENKEEKDFRPARFSWYPGHMAKTKKQIIDDLKLIDIVIEVLDSRCPISTRNDDLEQELKNKKVIYALNKSDLADDEETLKWINYFKSQGRSSIKIQANESKGLKDLTNTILNLYDDSKDVKQGKAQSNIKVMIIGIPNVGKSTLINSLSNSKKAGVQNKPGFTKQKQWIKINNGINLLDEPGMLWPRLENEYVKKNLAFINAIPENVIDNEEIAYYLLDFLWKNYKDSIKERYKIEDGELKTLQVKKLIAQNRGCMLRGGNIDEVKVANTIINDFRNGKLGKITLEKVEDIG